MSNLTSSSKEYSKVCTQIYVHLKNKGLNRRNALKTSSIHKFIKNYDGTIVVTDKERQTWILNKAINNEFKDWPVQTDATKSLREQILEKIIKPRRLLKTKQNKRSRKHKRINKREYYNYLKTTEWSNISKMVIKRDNNKCTKCGGTYTLQAHHMHYKNIFNEMEHLEDLITLCKICHTQVHSKK